MLTAAVFSQVHIRIRWRAAEPLEQMCAYSGDALLISECSLPSGWRGEVNRQ